MPHSTSLIATIVVGLVFAFACGFVARRLHLPPLVGYLLAGIAVGPFTPGFVADISLAGQLAEIGVILLMFGIGLHFSIKDLLEVYAIALPGALAQIAASMAACAATAVLWGWGLAAGLLLGLGLSVANTVVLLRFLEERNALDNVDGRIAIGWLIVQDLAMVLVLVLLPALAGSSEGHPPQSAPRVLGDGVGVTLALTVAKVAAFVGLVLVVGTRLVPWLLEQVARTGSRELFTLSVLATALGIAYGSAELFGVSFALGAFFAGVVLSESDLSHQAAADSLPLRDASAVLFFVSVGMLFDPMILVSSRARCSPLCSTRSCSWQRSGARRGCRRGRLSGRGWSGRATRSPARASVRTPLNGGATRSSSDTVGLAGRSAGRSQSMACRSSSSRVTAGAPRSSERRGCRWSGVMQQHPACLKRRTSSTPVCWSSLRPIPSRGGASSSSPGG
jgi:monovalent cation:proton antiporter-2 (CPA2) family protein